jgi:hypothetical protein
VDGCKRDLGDSVAPADASGGAKYDDASGREGVGGAEGTGVRQRVYE